MHKSNSFFYQKVKSPENFGILKWKKDKIIDIIEKPKEFVSDMAIIGVYYFNDGENYILSNSEVNPRVCALPRGSRPVFL